jgi:hypothetical protein
MAVLRHNGHPEWRSLSARTLVGRRSHCQLVLDQTHVGREHAVLSFDGERWHVRDLASQNGTFLEGSRLRPGIDYEVEAGTVLCFGNVEDGWEMVVDGGPDPAAVADDGQIVAGENGMLALPPGANENELELLVERQHDGLEWAAYRADSSLVVHDQQVVVIAGRRWTLLLPAVLDVGASTQQAGVQGTTIILRTSSDETELRSARIVVDKASKEIERPQTAWKLVLALAKYRLEREAGDPSKGADAWMPVRRACKAAGIQYGQFAYTLHRARKYLAAAGAPDAGRLIAQRENNGEREVRLTECNVTIVHS